METKQQRNRPCIWPWPSMVVGQELKVRASKAQSAGRAARAWGLRHGRTFTTTALSSGKVIITRTA